MSESPPPRVRVTGPPRHPRRTSRPDPDGTDGGVEQEGALGLLYTGSLLRAQRAGAVRTLAALALTVGALPLLFHLVPALGRVQVVGVPLPWLLVGVASYPVLLLLGWRHLRRAERVERDYLGLAPPRRDR